MAWTKRLILLADLAGTAVFATEGALMAIGAKLDLLGVGVLAFSTALGGGILLYILLGAQPPAAFRSRFYLLSVLAGVVTAIGFADLLHGAAADFLLSLDAAGLSLFAVAGTEKALELGSRRFAAAMLGTMTATGGGVIRDVLLARVPVILRADFYATAALGGSIVVIVARAAGISMRESALVGGMACFLLRMLGARLHWNLPVPG